MRFLLGLALLALSQQPSPRSGVPGSAQQRRGATRNATAKQDERGTDKAPLVVKALKTQTESEQEAEDRKEKTQNDRQLVTFTGSLVTATYLLGAVAVFQLVVFGYQSVKLKQTVEAATRQEKLTSDSLDAMRRSADASTMAAAAAERTVEVMQATARQQLRAYLFTGPSEVGPWDGSETSPTVILTIKNYGQTPAYDFVVHGSQTIGPYDYDGELPQIPDVEPPSKGSVPPGETRFVRLRHMTIVPDDILAIKDGSRSIFVHGTLQYRDIFGQQHTTKFRSRLLTDLRVLRALSVGNEAD
jgi:hypothetical protein